MPAPSGGNISSLTYTILTAGLCGFMLLLLLLFDACADIVTSFPAGSTHRSSLPDVTAAGRALINGQFPLRQTSGPSLTWSTFPDTAFSSTNERRRTIHPTSITGCYY